MSMTRVSKSRQEKARATDKAESTQKSNLSQCASDGQTQAYEFGGAWGVTAMMIVFPLLMWYLWLTIKLHNGALFLPSWNFFEEISTHAAPTRFAWKLYVGFSCLQAFLAVAMPGPVVKGLPLPFRGNTQLEYVCNGVSSFYFLIFISVVLHWSQILPLTAIVDSYGPIMSVAIICGILVSLITYIVAVATRDTHRMTGSVLYDIFMGAPLNPRIGPLDLKMWAEIRIPWVILFYISLSAALKQREDVGYISPEMYFMVIAHFLYVNACMKGEECIPTTWDIFYEKWGFMLIFWNLAGVPFTYCLSTLYLLQRGPLHHSFLYVTLCFCMLLCGYYIWDTANSQKNRFRMQQRGTYIPRRTFPQLPWGTLKNPSYLITKQGNYILTDGWWGYARKIHYTADLAMALSWGLITGHESAVPYFYFAFFVCVLWHRASRDMERCARKYGADWETYCSRVPYIFIPGIV